MYFQYGETEINYLKRKDKKLAWAIEQIGHIERKLDANLLLLLYVILSVSRYHPRHRRRFGRVWRQG